MGASGPPQRKGTTTPRLASYRTHLLPSSAVPLGHGSHCSEAVLNTNPFSHSNTSYGSSHASSPPGQNGGSLLIRVNAPDCHCHVAASIIDASPFAPTVGRALFRTMGIAAASLSPVSVSYRTAPDAPSNDVFRISVSSASLSTDPSSPTSILLMAMAAVQIASYMPAQYWSHGSSSTACVRPPSKMSWFSLSSGSLVNTD
eukprot:1554306-Rhodomonas_salina.1